MVRVSATDFSAHKSKYFDLARSGVKVVVNSRSYGEFYITPKKNSKKRKADDFRVTPELLAKIERAEQEMREGKCTVCNTIEEVKAHLASL